MLYDLEVFTWGEAVFRSGLGLFSVLLRHVFYDATMTADNRHYTYIFNPEHDLALAYGTEGYTAPPRARWLRRDLQMLPAWYGNSGAEILSQNQAEDHEWLSRMGELMGISATPVALNKLQCRNSQYIPWGWNLDLRQRLLNACVPASDLPSRQQIVKLQELSHRRISIEILKLLNETIDMAYLPLPIEVHSVDEIRSFNTLHPGCYIKAPWSGSGKGVYRVLDADCRSFATWAQGIINRQGSIMCEQPLDKVLDFAMEFECNDGKARFAGYSIFSNDSHCSYDSGLVMPSPMLQQLIAKQLHGNTLLLARVQEALAKIITQLIAPHYTGYLGIDMMVYNDNGTMHLNPCVEANLRMTMGIVASFIAERHIATGTGATFRVTYHKSPDDLKAFANNESRNNPLQLTDDGLIASGFLPLTPIYHDSHFLAHIIAGKAHRLL